MSERIRILIQQKKQLKLIELIDNTRKTAFGSADFRIINFNDIKNVLAFCRKIMCGAIAGDYEHRYNKKLFERIKHHGTSR